MRTITGIALSLALLPLTSCQGVGPTNFFFNQLEIDSELHLRPQGPRSLSAPGSGSSFSFFRGAYITSVEHFAMTSGSASPADLLYLEADLNQRLSRTVKTDRLLDGPFGSIYVTRHCFYNKAPGAYVNYISVEANQRGAGEVPSEVLRPTGDLPPLTSVGLIRVFRSDGGYEIVTASYEANGKLGGIYTARTFASEGAPINPAQFLYRGGRDPRLEQYGIPPTIDVQHYLQRHDLVLPAASLALERAVVTLHFGFNKLLRRDDLRDGAIASSTFLQPSVTREEQQLGPECENQLRRQMLSGQRTVD